MNKLTYQNALIQIANLDRRYAANKRIGWVYVLRNPEFKRPLFKIGQTSRPPHVRADELTRETGVPEAYQVVYFVHVSDRHAAERAVHDWLSERRVRWNKEFFEVPLALAVEALDAAARYFPVLVGSKRRRFVLPQAFDVTEAVCPACTVRNQVKQLAVRVKVRCRGCGAALEPATDVSSGRVR